jgi:membrane protease YdiL (CAAX protease family)
MKISKAFLISLIFYLTLNILNGLFALVFYMLGFNILDNYTLIPLIGKTTLLILSFTYLWKINLIKTIRFAPTSRNANNYLFLLTIAIGFMIAIRPSYDVFLIISKLRGNDFPIPISDFDGYNLSFFYSSINTIIIAPVVEELIFRKYLIDGLLTRYRAKISIIISSICFALIHIETPSVLVTSFFFGLFAGLIYIKTEKIRYTIILHFLYNLSTILFKIFGSYYYQALYKTDFNLAYWLYIALGMFFLFSGTKKLTNFHFDNIILVRVIRIGTLIRKSDLLKKFKN